MEHNHIKGENWTNNEAKIIGQKLRELRVQLGYSLEELADMSGLNISTITRIEDGRFNTGVRQLTQLLDAMGYTIDFIKK